GVERLRQDAETLDLLDARELPVRAVDLRLEQLAHLRMMREAGETGIGNSARTRPVGHRIEVDLDERTQILARMPEHRDLGDVWAAAHEVLDVRRRNRLAAGGDDEVAHPIDDAQPAVGPRAGVAGAQPTLPVESVACRFAVAPVP